MAGDEFDQLGRHDLTGLIMQTGINAYFGANRLHEALDARVAGAVVVPDPAWGSFATNVETSYWFGMPRDVQLSGVLMDIDQYGFNVAARSGDREWSRAYRMAAGARLSANEHLVPEALFGDKGASSGVSAAKALAIAASEGQRVYVLSNANVDAALANLDVGSQVQTDILAAVRSGREVTVHQREIRHGGWTGVGYVVHDPQTGSSGWIITGGANGGFLDFLGYLLAVFSNSVDFKTALLGSDQSEMVRSYFLRYLSLAGAALDVMDMASSCVSANLFGRAMALSGLVSGILLSIALLALLGPIAGLLISLVTIPLMSGYKGYLRRNYC